MNVLDQASGHDWTLYNGDSAEVLKGLPDHSVDFSCYSPPFGNLYTYSPTDRDLGNVRNEDEFFAQFSFITREMLRIIKPGRLMAVHCMDLVTYETRDGVAGLKDFPGMLIKHFQDHGFVYHSRFTINKSPQAQAIRNHPRGLLFVQLERDASWMRQGLADYVVVMRTPGDNAVPIKGDLSHEEWIEWAHPVWNNIRETDVLETGGAKENDDERHLCALQIPVIERCVRLWSNRGEVVLTPFAGIGSELYGALLHHRKAVGVELKPSYFRVAVKNIQRAEVLAAGSDLFTWAARDPEGMSDPTRVVDPFAAEVGVGTTI